MTCNCNKSKETKEEECPEGQSFDVSQGKCVANSEKKKEQFGDAPESQKADLADSDVDTGDVQKVENQECPPGHSYDSETEQCMPTAPEVPEIADTKADISKEKLARLESDIAELKMKEKKPTAQVGADSDVKSFAEVAKEYPRALETYGTYKFTIPHGTLRSVQVGRADAKTGVKEAFRNVPAQITEAVSLSGTHATQDLDTDVAIVPGGISFIPVFQFAKVKEISAGADRARFFKTTLPSNGSQTVGTTPSEATQTITSIEVTPSTITGTYLIGDFDEIENSPFDLLQVIVEGSSASYEDFVATDMLDTISKEGTLTAGLWIRADTGATITSSDVASVAFDETGVAYGREYLENQGYLRGGVKPVLFLHPKQWRELITSTNVTSLATRSVPDIWLKAQLEELMGVQLVVTNAVEAKNNSTNDAYNAIMCIPKHSYGIGIKRDVTVKMHEIPEDNQVRVNTTWRTKAGVIDGSSIVRISSTQ
tara:strand:+ start:179 stop:1627 length:1449 start_codon:yes stop_codon:yes gene_type:complete